MTVPFGRVLKLGMRGNDVKAVKMALKAQGYGKDLGFHTLFGPALVRQLRLYQQAQKIQADGVYGKQTHNRLSPTFTPEMRVLYTSAAALTVQLPATFTPTHQTGGLPGYPAVDVFAKPGTQVLAPEAGTLTRFSGKDPAQGGTPGGAYGWSMYLTVPHAEYFLTHFGSRTYNDGDEGTPVQRGEVLGTVCDAKVAGMPSSSSHIHEGKKEL